MYQKPTKRQEKYAIIRSKGSEDKNPLNGLESFAGEMQQKALQQEQQLVDNARKVFLGEVQAKRTGLTEDPGVVFSMEKKPLRWASWMGFCHLWMPLNVPMYWVFSTNVVHSN
jgi:hypothetical protein